MSFPAAMLLALAGLCLPAEAAGLSAEQRTELEFRVMAGEMAAGRQQPAVAAEQFLRALELAPDARLAGRATQLALASGNDALALDAARRWNQLEPNSLEAREVLTRIGLRQGLDDEVYAQCQAIVRDHPGGRDDGYRHVALLFGQEPKSAERALALMARLVADRPKQAGAWQAQALLALRFDQRDLAERSAREALRLNPASKDAPLLLVGALVRKPDLAAADAVIENQLKTASAPAELRLGYARLLVEANQRAHARDQLLKALKLEPALDDASLLLALLAMDDRRYDEAEAALQPLTKLGGDRAGDAEYYLGRIAEARSQPAAALAHYNRVRAGNQVLEAAVHKALVLGQLGQMDEARTVLGLLRQQLPLLSARFWLIEGDLLSDGQRLDDALALYDTAIAQASDDARDLRYARSLVYEKLGRVADAEVDLRSILAGAPDESRALNALGYMLVVHSDRLDEADQLLSRAMELSPEEPAVIDSLGWLRFRQGRQAEAVLLLGRAYARFPDPEVAAHYGEALWASGDRSRAQDVLDQALRRTPDSSLLRETLERLRK